MISGNQYMRNKRRYLSLKKEQNVLDKIAFLEKKVNFLENVYFQDTNLGVFKMSKLEDYKRNFQTINIDVFKDISTVVTIIKIPHLKTINMKYGKTAGNKLLKAVIWQLKTVFPEAVMIKFVAGSLLLISDFDKSLSLAESVTRLKIITLFKSLTKNESKLTFNGLDSNEARSISVYFEAGVAVGSLLTQDLDDIINMATQDCKMPIEWEMVKA